MDKEDVSSMMRSIAERTAAEAHEELLEDPAVQVALLFFAKNYSERDCELIRAALRVAVVIGLRAASRAIREEVLPSLHSFTSRQ